MSQRTPMRGNNMMAKVEIGAAGLIRELEDAKC